MNQRDSTGCTEEVVLDRVEQTPGVNVAKLAKELDLGWTATEYHVRKLLARQMIRSQKIRGKIHLFPADLSSSLHIMLSVIQNRVACQALCLVTKNPGCRLIDLQKWMDERRSVLRRRLQALQEAGLIERRGLHHGCYFLVPTALLELPEEAVNPSVGQVYHMVKSGAD